MSLVADDDTLEDVQDVLTILESYIFLVNIFLTFISIFINSFHLIIITRKSMRTSSINILMIGIAVCDLFTMFTTVYKYFNLVDRENPECITGDSLMKVYMDVTSWSSQYHFRRSSCWLGILMASVRYIIMRKMSNVRHTKIGEPRMGFILAAIVFFASVLLTVTWQFECKVIENRNFSLPVNCAEHQDINSHPKFSIILRPLSNIAAVLITRTYFILDATISNFIPCLAFPTLTVLLLRQIHKINERRSEMRRTSVTEENEEKHGLTTKVIIFITISFFIAEAPLGTIATLKTFIDRSNPLFRLLTEFVVYFTTLVTINSLLHPIFCIVMSSQYRETIKSLLRIKRKTSVMSAQKKVSFGSTQVIHMT
ncbi:hypothetical protein CRE_19047 [Caenorhabditis remanei]|uniref:G-protein coupled receptors family 1 profile domain-containing protein n=1 Tax=Caenorhabditis remanei TaxID=31234 RepID=E3LLE5_CAERE|nr:hypothetical protein CRE_19047 [Caenorhabditis remanei]